jgi:hypothetical protein
MPVAAVAASALAFACPAAAGLPSKCTVSPGKVTANLG